MSAALRRPIRFLLIALALSGTVLDAQTAPPHLPPLDRVLPKRAETIYRAVAPRVETDAAMDLVSRMAPLWRVAGNPHFDQSLEWIEAQLSAAGIATRYETIESASRGWEMREAVLRLDGPDGEIVLSREQDRVPLAINSFSTQPEGASFPLVDVGKGTDASDYQGKDVTGAVVLADGTIGSVWNEAVKGRGAAGVISTQIAAYTRPETTPEVLQWGSIPFDPENVSFGFKATPRAARRLRERLAGGAVRVHVRAETVFHRRPVRTLVAEIPGSALARGSRRARRPRAGARRQRQRQRERNAAGRGRGDATRHQGRRHSSACQDHHHAVG